MWYNGKKSFGGTVLLIDLHCPVEHLSTDFTHDDRDNVRAYIKLNNLSGHFVERLDAVAIFTDGSNRRAQLPFSMEKLYIKPRSAFKAIVTTSELPTATHVDIQFTRVIFAGDEPLWMYSAARLVEIPDLPRPDGRDLNRLIDAAGDDAVVFPIRTGHLWICVCSRANPYRRKKCRRCGRERDHVLDTFDMARLLTQPAPRRKAKSVDLTLLFDKPSSQAKKAQRKQRFLRERRMLIRRTITMLVIIALILLFAWVYHALTTKPQSIVPTKREIALIQCPYHA